MRPALVIEGGGMKAAYANGVLSAFEEAGLRPKAVYGTSAGGALAAWFSAGQARYAEGTWKYARDARILNYRRALLLRGPLLDHEALLDLVYCDEHPLDVAALRRCRWPVIVTAVDADTAQVFYRDIRKDDAILWLKATGRLPFASGRPVHWEGRRLLDGGVVDPIPVRKAVADGHRHAVVILNKPPGPHRPDPRWIVRATARRYPALTHGVAEHQHIKHQAYLFAQQPPPGVRIDIIRPTHDTGLHRLSRDQRALDDAIDQGRRDGEAYLDQD